MKMEAQVDRAAECATDAAHDAYSVPDAPFVYTKESWADCVGDIVTHPDSDEDLRRAVQRVLFWTNAVHSHTVDAEHAMIVGGALNSSVHALGYLTATNAIKNGVTLENIGEVMQ
jgi:hypothetical protein